MLVSLCVGSTINYNFGSTAYAKATTPNACEIRTTTTEASKEGQEFVEYILEKENIDILAFKNFDNEVMKMLNTMMMEPLV